MAGAKQNEFCIPHWKIASPGYIANRLVHVPVSVRGAVKTTLEYLYLPDGPRNLPSDRKRLAEPYLDVAERVLVRWLQPRTNGQ